MYNCCVLNKGNYLYFRILSISLQKLEIFINYVRKITNMTSVIAPLVSLRNRLRQALARCSRFFDP